jgi:hypothetical protein
MHVLHERVEPVQTTMHLVAQPVGSASTEIVREYKLWHNQ